MTTGPEKEYSANSVPYPDSHLIRLHENQMLNRIIHHVDKFLGKKENGLTPEQASQVGVELIHEASLAGYPPDFSNGFKVKIYDRLYHDYKTVEQHWLAKAKFAGADLQGASIGNVTNATFIDTQFGDNEFGLNHIPGFVGVLTRKAGEAIAQSIMSEAQYKKFSDSKLVSTYSFKPTSKKDSKVENTLNFIRNLDVDGEKLTPELLSQLGIEIIRITSCSLYPPDFSEKCLKEANLTGMDISGGVFDRADMRGAKFFGKFGKNKFTSSHPPGFALQTSAAVGVTLVEKAGQAGDKVKTYLRKTIHKTGDAPDASTPANETTANNASSGTKPYYLSRIIGAAPGEDLQGGRNRLSRTGDIPVAELPEYARFQFWYGSKTQGKGPKLVTISRW